MVRIPCCEKHMGVKKGPWTPEEDQTLISHIRKHSHGNWRALPSQAGLLRCGKSCRLRWINYLRPDLKRGNFTREEEDTIINLHETIGNRWSVIAARLPGRTDNEIKNVWHTSLKKRKDKDFIKSAIKNVEKSGLNQNYSLESVLISSQPSSSDLSSAYTNKSSVSNSSINNENEESLQFQDFPEIDERFWSEPEVNLENSTSSIPLFVEVSEFSQQQQFGPFELINDHGTDHMIDDNMEFWFDLFIKSGGVQEFL